MRARYYDRRGQPMDLWAWAKAFEGERHIAETTLSDGTWISTVWIGLDHQYGDGPPLIFETMVFAARGGDEREMARYTTEAEALAGHEYMVAKWSQL